jgi:hypothetical protein
MRLEKYVIVLENGNWPHITSSLREAREMVARNAGTHLELWIYNEQSDGSHDTPSKRRIK